MKKDLADNIKAIVVIILAIFAMWLCTSCKDSEHTTVSSEDSIIVNGPGSFRYGLFVIDITIEDETHQYLYLRQSYSTCITHWEGCKYCKQ